MFGCNGAIAVLCGRIWIGIERDGYAHS
jgi:hypothetical protein